MEKSGIGKKEVEIVVLAFSGTSKGRSTTCITTLTLRFLTDQYSISIWGGGKALQQQNRIEY